MFDPGDRGYQAGAASTVNSLANRLERGRDHVRLYRAQDGGTIPDGGEDDGTRRVSTALSNVAPIQCM